VAYDNGFEEEVVLPDPTVQILPHAVASAASTLANTGAFALTAVTLRMYFVVSADIRYMAFLKISGGMLVQRKHGM
jgi:hypothetical protein